MYLLECLKTGLIGVSIFAVTGCANLNSVYRHNHLSKPGQTEFVDAKQRAIIAAPVEKWKKVDPNTATGAIEYDRTMYRICSEPAPDVFSAYAFSGSAEAQKDAANIGAKFGMSSAETAATIERTQVVNMLRESMFRTCERYMNGAMTDSQMNIQTARDQRMMVALLAIEQLTGVVKRKPTVLSTGAAALMAESSKSYIEKLEKAEQATKTAIADLEKAEADKKIAQEEYDKENTKAEGAEEGLCDVAMKPKAAAVAGATAATPPAPDAAKAASCKSKKETVDQKAADLNTKKSELDIVQKREGALISQVQKISGAAYLAFGTGSGDGGSNAASTQQIKDVALIVKEITELTFNDQSELNFACVEALKKGSSSNESLYEPCLKLFESQIDRAYSFNLATIHNNYSASEARDLVKAIPTLKELQKLVINLPVGRAKQILSNPPVSLNASASSYLNAWGSLQNLTDENAKSILGAILIRNSDVSSTTLQKWNAEFTTN